MSYKLFLDDERHPAQVGWVEIGTGPWMIVRNYDEFISAIKEHGVPWFVTFDHDLADFHYQVMLAGGTDYGTEKTGYDCAKWLVEYCLDNSLPLPDFEVHSMNPVGKENIKTYLANAKKHLNL